MDRGNGDVNCVVGSVSRQRPNSDQILRQFLDIFGDGKFPHFRDDIETPPGQFRVATTGFLENELRSETIELVSSALPPAARCVLTRGNHQIGANVCGQIVDYRSLDVDLGLRIPIISPPTRRSTTSGDVVAADTAGCLPGDPDRS